MYPQLGPADLGVKTRFIFTLCLGLKVMGNVSPLAENPVPTVWKP
jgi:hypothetical protein